MAKANTDTPDTTKPAENPEFVKITLDRRYVYGGEFYGPGEVEVPPNVALDLNKAYERAKMIDAENAKRAQAIDEAEDARREQGALKDKAVS